MQDRIIYNTAKDLAKAECPDDAAQVTIIRDTIERVCMDANPDRIYVPNPRPPRTVDLGWCRRTWDKWGEWTRTAAITAARPGKAGAR